MHTPLHHLSLPSTAWLPKPMPNRSDRPSKPPAHAEPYAAWRRPSLSWRILFVGLALAMPGGLLGAMIGLATGAFEESVLAAGLLAAIAGATVEIRSAKVPQDQPPADSNSP